MMLEASHSIAGAIVIAICADSDEEVVQYL